ncbi:N-acetyl-gamma-glutamyl-phosphate reductase [Desulforhopalus singaporensis]|uniref:N-acetyl-gamma-glutamyl-phosphate reductase n=1 Tax=Desulforhopalus singaporensis TaxID=91360 RepID=A0A1H0V5D3_9BACT|nr:N-acetyl-gamma-glutamyl-phosphate reductase [Desulforhopalus singaporensis]SDP73650.1 N-acetyl-gamma-glutamyl-phosphate reductase [Desulforhopalus singaporensis]
MINVGIIGASGYTGAELARLLCCHPEANISVATSRQYEGRPLSEVFPSLRKKADIICENLTPDELAARADLFFTAVPHKTAMDLVPSLLAHDKKVIDLSADFRIRDVSVYEKWYQPHSSPEFLREAVYGLPELYRSTIKSARLIANPGCYPTSIILGLAPLLKADGIDPNTIIADSKSGTSGAGRGAQTGTLFCEVHDGFRPYKVGRAHRHTPEIEQELSLLAGTDAVISFTPHLLPISRGILSTIYATLRTKLNQEQIISMYREFYQDEFFVRVLDEDCFPATNSVRGSNFCDISVKVDPATNRVIVMSAIDNVVKGASGQAVQNMNIMCGFDETSGLDAAPFFP